MGGPDPAMLIPALANAIGIPPEELAQLLASLNPENQQKFFLMPFEEQVALLTSILQELGMQAAPPGPPMPPLGDSGPPSPPPDPLMMPPAPGMVPPPPPMPGPGGPAPIAMMPDGSMSMLPPPPMPPPPPPPEPPPMELQLLSMQEQIGAEPRKERRKAEPPKHLKDLKKLKAESPFGGRPPTWEEVIADGMKGPKVYAGRDQDIDDLWDIFHLINHAQQLDGSPTEPLAGELWHTWNKPAVLVDQIVGAVSPDPARLMIQCDPWDDTAECEESAQHIENYYRTQIDRNHDIWAEKGTRGDPLPPFDRMVALIAFIEGGCGQRYYADPDEDGMFFFEPVPLRQLYPVGRAVVRILDMTLDEARAHYSDIRKAWPARDEEKDRRGGKAYPDGEERVRIIVWADVDGLWECIAWDFGSPRDEWYGGRSRKSAKQKQWIKEPQALDYGFCPLWYDTLWLGSGVSGNASMRPADNYGIDAGVARSGDQRVRLRHRGGLTAIREQVHLGSQLISIIATGANYVTNPAMVFKVNPNNPTDLVDASGKPIRKNPSRRLGAISQMYIDESMEPVPVSPEGTQSLQALFNVIQGQVGDAARPVLAGGGDSASGADRYIANSAAEDHMVTPLKRWLMAWHRTGLRHTGIMASRRSSGKGQLFTSLPYRAGVRTPLRDPEGKRPANGMGGAVIPADFARQGVDCRVRYRIDDPIKLQQLAAAYGMLLDKGAIDMFGFRDAVQIEDVLQMDRRVDRDQARADEAFKKARIGTALLEYHKNGGDLTLPLLYFQERMKERQSSGSPPAPVGMGSPPAPGQPSMGQGPLPGMGG